MRGTSTPPLQTNKLQTCDCLTTTADLSHKINEWSAGLF